MIKTLTIQELLDQTGHRDFPLPNRHWAFYQEWQDVLFLHWKIPYRMLRELVPDSLTLDCYDGEYYISLVPFSMKNVRPRFLPAFSPVSDFHEINLRTYIQMGGRRGVYFLSIEAEKQISTWISRTISGMPYEKSHIVRDHNCYQSSQPGNNKQLDLEYVVTGDSFVKSPLDHWLTDRYCLFLTEAGQVYRYDVHHVEWPILPVKLLKYHVNYQIGNLVLQNQAPTLMHFSRGVQVLAWGKQLESTI
jgi:uncharacterized protein YqjF (DUF2071 family)